MTLWNSRSLGLSFFNFLKKSQTLNTFRLTIQYFILWINLKIKVIVVMIFHDLDLLPLFEVASEIFYSSNLFLSDLSIRELICHPPDKIVLDLLEVIKFSFSPPMFKLFFFDNHSLISLSFLWLSFPLLSKQLCALFLNDVLLFYLWNHRFSWDNWF